ncbi:hypothetical protein EDB83DRAFT_2527434 [Lactarius deliciosus]|nr:hypothetical protein EDB83DRAFT_2527434 [Lactarius deliciosus]
MASAYAGKTILNYLNGVRAWHILHSIPWTLNKDEMDTMLRAAAKLMLDTSKRKLHCPYTPDFIAAIKQDMDMETPLDAAIFACLSTCFYTSARLGEFTVRTQESFCSGKHVTTQNLSYDQDRGGNQVTVLHLPFMKAAGRDGEDVYWATQTGKTDPTAALQNHLHVNQPLEASHLFAYRAKKTRRPLTKSKFLERVEKATHAAGLEPLQGHAAMTLAPNTHPTLLNRLDSVMNGMKTLLEPFSLVSIRMAMLIGVTSDEGIRLLRSVVGFADFSDLGLGVERFGERLVAVQG